MAVMSRYAKAYPVSRLREFSLWNEKRSVEPVEGEPDAYVFVHENLIVTGGVFQDTDIIFDSITDEWKEFCANKLEFSIPADVANMDAEIAAREKLMAEAEAGAAAAAAQ